MSNGKTFLGELTKDLQIKVSKSTLSRIVNSYKALKYKKIKSQPRMTKTHQQNRLNWTFWHVLEARIWKNNIFRWKKFDLDGPDCFFNYWYDQRKHAGTFSKRHQAWNSLMVSAAFWIHGKVNTAFPSGRTNVLTYQYLLEETCCLLLRPLGDLSGVPTGQCIHSHRK